MIPGPMDRNGRGKSRLYKSNGLPDKTNPVDKATRFSLWMGVQGDISKSDSKIPGPIGKVQVQNRQWKSTGLPDEISVFKIDLDKAAKKPKKSVVSTSLLRLHITGRLETRSNVYPQTHCDVFDALAFSIFPVP